MTSRIFRIAKFRLSLLIICGFTVLSGCPSDTKPKPAQTTKPFRGQEVELVMPASLKLPALWEVTLNEWMDETGATIRWSEYSGTDADSLESKLANSPESGGRIILFRLQKLAEIDQQMAPIEGNGFDTKDIFKGLREHVVKRNRAAAAIPISAPVLNCYYRADLLKKAGRKPPETWKDYQDLIDTLEQWAPGLTAVEPLSADHRATLFFARSLAFTKHPENFSVWFDLDAGKPTLDTAGFVEATEVALRAWKKMPVNVVELSPADCREQILQGRAALAIGIEPTANSKSTGDSRPAMEVGVCRLPGSTKVFNRNSKRWDSLPAVHAPGICGFDGLAIGVSLPKESRDAAAWHLLSNLVGESFESNWAALPKSPCRESQTSTATSWYETGLTVEEMSRSVDATAQTLRDGQLVADLPIPEANEFRKATSSVVGKLLAGELDPAQTCQQLQSEFEQIVNRIGSEKLRTDYRRGLGLPILELLESSK